MELRKEYTETETRMPIENLNLFTCSFLLTFLGSNEPSDDFGKFSVD